MNRYFKKLVAFIFPLLFLTQSCGIYSFTGGSVGDMKTVGVQFFENTAPLVVPYLSTQFTEALKERIRNQSSLSIVRTEGDGNFEGRITNYSIQPAAVEATQNQRAALNRLSITVNVKFTNNTKPDLSFEQSFTRYVDFAGTVQSNEARYIKDINTQLTEDIYNRAFANW